MTFYYVGYILYCLIEGVRVAPPSIPIMNHGPLKPKSSVLPMSFATLSYDQQTGINYTRALDKFEYKTKYFLKPDKKMGGIETGSKYVRYISFISANIPLTNYVQPLNRLI